MRKVSPNHFGADGLDHQDSDEEFGCVASPEKPAGELVKHTYAEMHAYLRNFPDTILKIKIGHVPDIAIRTGMSKGSFIVYVIVYLDYGPNKAVDTIIQFRFDPGLATEGQECWFNAAVERLTDAQNKHKYVLKLRPLDDDFQTFAIMDIPVWEPKVKRKSAKNDANADDDVVELPPSDDERDIRSKRGRSSDGVHSQDEKPPRKTMKSQNSPGKPDGALEPWNPFQDVVPRKALEVETVPLGSREKIKNLLKTGAAIKYPHVKDAAATAIAEFEQKLFDETSPMKYVENVIDKLGDLFDVKSVDDLQARINILEAKLIALKAHDASIDKTIREKLTAPQEKKTAYLGAKVFVRAEDAGITNMGDYAYVSGTVIGMAMTPGNPGDAPNKTCTVQLSGVNRTITCTKGAFMSHPEDTEWTINEIVWVLFPVDKSHPSNFPYFWAKSKIVDRDGEGWKVSICGGNQLENVTVPRKRIRRVI